MRFLFVKEEEDKKAIIIGVSFDIAPVLFEKLKETYSCPLLLIYALIVFEWRWSQEKRAHCQVLLGDL